MIRMISYFNNFVSDTGILFILVIIDTVLAISAKIANNEAIVSNKLLSGLLRNITLSFVPMLLDVVNYLAPRNDMIYSIIAMVVTILLGYGMIISILTNINILGIKYPDWLMNALRGEIESKTGVNLNELSKSKQSDNGAVDKQNRNNTN